MAGRNPRPVAMLKAAGTHESKARLAAREAAEIRFGDKLKQPPAAVKANAGALKKWRELVKLYEGQEFISNADAGAVARYCLAFAEYLQLVEMRANVAALTLDPERVVEALQSNDLTEIAGAALEVVAYVNGSRGVLQIDKAINAKMTTLLQLEDRLFLNPLAKIRNVPVKETTKKDPLAAAGFEGL